MATITTIQSPRVDSDPSALPRDVRVNILQRGLPISEFDFKDNRYPPLSPPKITHTMIQPSSNHQPWDASSGSVDWLQKVKYDPPRKMDSPALNYLEVAQEQETLPELTSGEQLQQTRDSKPDSAVSYALLAGPSRRVVERYSLEGREQFLSNGTPEVKEPYSFNKPPKSAQGSATASQHSPAPPQPEQSSSKDFPPALIPANPRHPSLSQVGIGTGKNNSGRPYSPNMGITIPISPNPRAFAQHPTYITPAATPDPINPVLSPPPPVPIEEVCVECAMRDQDMADVDVTSPGVWDRESDVHYDDLLQSEREEESSAIVSTDPSKPRARGGRLTEPNLKIWLTMNPREPAARQQTLDQYLKSQRTLLEAEALAHARAMQEAMHLDNKMRDTYTQLRRSAYELGNTTTPVDDIGPVRIKAPRTPSSPIVGSFRPQSRELTLLENGMIVEHVDVRREEREEKERRRKEEKRDRSRARRPSRGSLMDVTSSYSVHSLAPHTDTGLMPSSRYSGITSNRPASSLVGLPQAYSQASFSDAHSPGSVSPRRTRFFGFRNLSAGWKSQESLAPSGMSGSMVDMHVALQREANGPRLRTPTDSGIRLPSHRQSQVWPPVDGTEELTAKPEDDKPKKKKNGLKKIWKLVKGSSNKDSSDNKRTRSSDRHEDDLPLAPPPPLSYLVDRGPGEIAVGRHASTPSLPSTTSPRNPLSSPGMSPTTAPSSILPSPTSSRPSGADRDAVSDARKPSGIFEDKDNGEAMTFYDGSSTPITRAVHPVTSEPDMRSKTQQADCFAPNRAFPSLPFNLSREKSLPPLPGEHKVRPQGNLVEPRPQTLYTYNPHQIPSNNDMDDLMPPVAPFRADVRRRSFGGITGRPNLGIQTLPLSGGFDQPANGHYNDFGISRRSLGRLGHIDENPQTISGGTKRKSRFGFAALLGKKSNPPTLIVASPITGPHEFPRITTPGSDGKEESTTAYTHSGWRHSVNAKMSITSRKPIDELVDQDPEFIAYRYPSNDQRFDVLR